MTGWAAGVATLVAGDLGGQDNVVGITPIFTVPDVAATVEYYRDRLGFEVVFVSSPEGVGDYGAVARGGSQIHFRQGTPPETPGVDGGVYIQVRDVDRFYAEIRERGAFGESFPRAFAAIREHPPEDKDYGLRDTIFVDLNGYVVCAGTPRE